MGAILGLAPNPVENILYQWFSSHPTDQYQFSTCFNDTKGNFQIGVNYEDKEIQPLINLRFDDTDKRMILSGVKSLTFGSVDLLSMKLDILVDTGSSFIVFPMSLYITLLKQLQ